MLQIKHVFTIVFLCLVTMLYGCDHASVKNTTVKADEETKIAGISPNNTTAAEVLSVFGNPQLVYKSRGNEIYVYTFCRQEKSPAADTSPDTAQTKELCNELNVTIDRTEQKVKDYSYKKQYGNE